MTRRRRRAGGRRARPGPARPRARPGRGARARGGRDPAPARPGAVRAPPRCACAGRSASPSASAATPARRSTRSPGRTCCSCATRRCCRPGGAPQGARTVRGEAAAREFESLREYVRGDEYRRIAWKATARRGKPVVVMHQPERGQTLLLALEAGRLMHGAGGDGPGQDRPGGERRGDAGGGGPRVRRRGRPARVLAPAAGDAAAVGPARPAAPGGRHRRAARAGAGRARLARMPGGARAHVAPPGGGGRVLRRALRADRRPPGRAAGDAGPPPRGRVRVDPRRRADRARRPAGDRRRRAVRAGRRRRR